MAGNLPLKMSQWKRLKGAFCKGLGDGDSYLQIWAVRTIIIYAEAKASPLVQGPAAWPARALSSFFSISPPPDDATAKLGASTGGPRVVDLAILVLVLAPMVQGKQALNAADLLIDR